MARGAPAGFVVPVLMVVAVGIFLLGAASPFDPIYQYYGVDIFTATAEDIARVRAALELDDGIFVQLWRWLTGLFSGELGTSRAFRQPVADVITQRLPWTLLLVSVGLIVMIVTALVVGVLAAWCQGGAARPVSDRDGTRDGGYPVVRARSGHERAVRAEPALGPGSRSYQSRRRRQLR